MLRLAVAGFCAVVLLAPATRAVVFYSTADPTYNTSAPTGSLSGSGWQWVGNWEGYAGTAIAPNFFITAHHVGGNIGDSFVLNGVSYTSTAFNDDSTTDLRVVQVSGTFPSWAPLYQQSGEVGLPLIVCGMGLSRGSEVTAGGALRGWEWGSNGSTLRWGQNTVNSIVNLGSGWGDTLYATFDANAGQNECDLAVGDSGGPVFVNDGSGWILAGVAAAVDGSFNTTDSGDGFSASIFDARGLYVGSAGAWSYIPLTDPSPVPTGFYATRVSERAAWINSVISPQTSDSPALDPVHMALMAATFMGCGIAALTGARRKTRPG